MEKTKIFAPFYLKKIVENFEGYWIGALSVVVILMALLPISNLVLGFPRLIFPWREVLFIDLVLLFSVGIICLPLLYWSNEEYKGKRFRTALAEATLLNWFWTLMLIPAGIINVLKLIVISAKAVYRTLKKPIIRQTIKKSVIAPLGSIFQRAILFIFVLLIMTFEGVKKKIKVPFVWFRKIWRLWKDNPILNGNGE